jgi:hypothetical protein
LNSAAANEADIAVSRSSCCVRLRRRRAKNIQKQIVTAAKAMTTKTPATARVFLKNAEFEEWLSGFRVGFEMTVVIVITPPLVV